MNDDEPNESEAAFIRTPRLEMTGILVEDNMITYVLIIPTVEEFYASDEEE